MPSPVTAVVKGICLFGADGRPAANSIEELVPSEPEHFSVRVQVFIGASTSDRSSSFDLLLCTPSWMAEQLSAGAWEQFRQGGITALPDSVVVGSGIWLMRRWDSTEFWGALRAVCAAYSPGPDLGSVASRISRLIPWEFGYKYDEHVNQRYGEPWPPDAGTS